jgi:hypothetical protein
MNLDQNGRLECPVRPPGEVQESLRKPRGTGPRMGSVDRAARILVVEDDDNVRFVTVAALRLGLFDVEEVPNGRDALRRIIDSANKRHRLPRQRCTHTQRQQRDTG